MTSEWQYYPFENPPVWVLDTRQYCADIVGDAEGFHVEVWCPVLNSMVSSHSTLTLKGAKDWVHEQITETRMEVP